MKRWGLWGGPGGDVHTFSSTRPPLAKGGHGLEWLKVTPLHLTGLVRLLPSQLVWPRARLLRGPQAGLGRGRRRAPEHTRGPSSLEPPQAGAAEGGGEPLAGARLPSRHVTCPRRSPRGSPSPASRQQPREAGECEPCRLPGPRPLAAWDRVAEAAGARLGPPSSPLGS